MYKKSYRIDSLIRIVFASCKWLSRIDDQCLTRLVFRLLVRDSPSDQGGGGSGEGLPYTNDYQNDRQLQM